MNKNKIILILCTLGVIGFGSYLNFKNNIKPEPAVQTIDTEIEIEQVQQPQTNPIEKKSFLEISEIQYEGAVSVDDNVYDFMKRLRDEGKINFIERNYIGIGKFIEEINGIRNTNNKFWIYYINGKKADIGVSDMKINEGDIVSWKFEQDINN